MTKHYQASCHCNAVKLSLAVTPITQGCRCNCSLCRRKGIIVSEPYFSPEQLQVTQGKDQLTLYQFGDHMVNHYFCKTCGIYIFHEAVAKPGHYRINLGCIDEIDLELLSIRKIDGAGF